MTNIGHLHACENWSLDFLVKYVYLGVTINLSLATGIFVIGYKLPLVLLFFSNFLIVELFILYLTERDLI